MVLRKRITSPDGERLHRVTTATLCRHHRSNARMKDAVKLFAEHLGNLYIYCELCRETRTVRTTAPYIEDGLFNEPETEPA